MHQKATIDAIPNENVGVGLKAALLYFETGEIPELDPLASVVFFTFKQYIDESKEDFKKFSEAGQRGNKKRWGNEVSPPDNPRLPPDTSYREAEAEAETLSTMHYAEAEAKNDGAHSNDTFSTALSTAEDLAEVTADRKLKLFGGELGKNVVFLSEDQIADLLDKMGIDAFDYYVDKLASYMLKTGAKPKSHYATIIKWWTEDGTV